MLRRTETRLFLFILLAAVAVGGLILAIGGREDALQGSGFGFDAETLENFDFSALPGNTIQVIGPFFSMRVRPPSGAGAESNVLTVGMDDWSYFVFDSDPDRQADTLCIDAIIVQFGASDLTDFDVRLGGDLLRGVEPLCDAVPLPSDSVPDLDFHVSVTTRTPDTIPVYEALELVLPTYQQFRFFPYDSFALRGTMQVRYRLLEGETTLVEANAAPLALWLYETSAERNWNLRMVDEPAEKTDFASTPFDLYNQLGIGPYTDLHLTIERPLLFRLAYPFLLSMMLLLILLLPFIGEFTALLEVSAAIIFGLFGLRQVLTPPDSQGQTLLDAVFIGLYVLLGIALIATLVVKWRPVRRALHTRPPAEGLPPEPRG
jgi:hypothetical protein